MVYSQIYGRNLILFQFTKKEISKYYKLTVSLLPILGKILEKTLSNSIFGYLHENNLLCENQSGLQPYDSYEYQLLSIVHKIYASYDCNPPLDFRAVFFRCFKSL